MTRIEQNEAIAKVLGFKMVDTYGQWIYPDKWRHLQACVPQYSVPDFVGILEDAVAFARKNWSRHDHTRVIQGECGFKNARNPFTAQKEGVTNGR